MVAVIGVDGVLVLERIVASDEVARLGLELQPPVAVAAERQHIAGTDATAKTFAHPAAVGIEHDAVECYMGVGLHIEAAEGGTLAGNVATDVAGTEVVARLQLVVAHLEILVAFVVLPPGAVERGAEGEVAVKWIVLNGHVGDGAPTVVAWHVGQV